MLSKKDLISHLSSIPKRGAATRGEQEAASYIYDLMKQIGLNSAIEPFKAPTRMPIIHFIHFFLIFIASLLVNTFPIASILMGGVVIVSFWGEFTHRFFILRYLTPHARSQNVTGKLGPDGAKLKVIISAHMDAARGGIIFSPRIANAAGHLKRQPLHKSFLIVMLVLLTVFIVKSFGGGTWFLSVIFNTVAVISLIVSILMIQWELSPYVPGANDDLSGIATMLSVAERLKQSPPDDMQFIFVATGAEEPHCSGMRAYIKAHKNEFSRDNSYFINLECLGGGHLKYVTQEGFIIFQRHDHTLIQIADIVSKKYSIDLKPTYTVAHSESIVPLTAGFKSIGLIALNENNVPTNYHQQSDIEQNIDYKQLDLAEEALLKMIEVMKEFRRLEFI